MGRTNEPTDQRTNSPTDQLTNGRTRFVGEGYKIWYGLYNMVWLFSVDLQKNQDISFISSNLQICNAAPRVRNNRMESNIPVCIQSIFLVGFHEFKSPDGIRVLALRTSDESDGSVFRCFTQVNHSPPATLSTKVFPTQPPSPTATTTSTSSTCLPNRLSPETPGWRSLLSMAVHW